MHVDDLSSAIYFIIKKKLNNNKLLLNYLKKSSLINVGSRNEYTIKQYAILIAKLVENKYKLVFNKSYPDGTKRKILDNSFMKKLGWKPKISLYKGLSDTIKWYKNNYL